VFNSISSVKLGRFDAYVKQLPARCILLLVYVNINISIVCRHISVLFNVLKPSGFFTYHQA